MKRQVTMNALFVLFTLFFGYAGAQTVVTEWTFEENPLLPNEFNPAPNTGAGSASVVGSMTGLGRSTGSSTGCVQTSGTGSWAFGTANPGTNESSGAQFMVPTTGYQGIRFTYDQRMSNTATRTERIQYTLDGTMWVNLDVNASNSTITCNGSYDNGRFDRGNTVGQNMSDSWSRKTVDFSAVAGVSNNPNFGVRIVAAHFQSTGEFRQANNSVNMATAGTWRFDNVRFTAAPANVSIVTANNFVVYNEDAGMIQIPVNVTNANASPISLTLGLAVYSTATENEDFIWTNTLSIPASSNGVFNLPMAIVDDMTSERTESVLVKLVSGTNASISATQYYQIIYIKDNDYQAPVGTNELGMTLLTSFSNGPIGANSAEIVVFDPTSDRLYVANSIAGKLDIIDFSNPSTPVMYASIDITPYGGINSVAVNNGLVALSIENAIAQLNGSVVFLDGDGVFINQVEVGAMPDMITFNKDFTKIITANEGEPNSDYSVDPEGSVSIVDLTPGIENLTNSDVTTISLAVFNGQEASLIAQGVRIFSTSASVAQDLEPEYVIVSDDNTKAFISLQENNAMLVIDLTDNSILSLNALGYSDYSSGNGMDASDQTGQILITSLPVKGAYMPDAMAYSTINGQGYVFTANEGDSREFGSVVDAARISSLTLDPTAFPDQAILKNNRFAGRLNGLRYSGDTDNDGDLDEIHVMGGRSFSIWDAATGSLVFDSKDMFEQITAAHPEFSAIFNASNSAATPTLKNRSDDKGPEPEGVTTAFINGSHYVFVSMERIGGAMIFNVDNPNSPVFVGYENNRSTTGIGPDLGAEGMIYISAEDSPNGNGLLILANEVSSTLSVYQVNTCAELSNTTILADQSEFCFGENATLSVSTDAAASIQWVYNGTEIVNETSEELLVANAGEYAALISNPLLSCSGLSDRIEIVVNALPEVTAITSASALCSGNELTLNGDGALEYTWSNSVTDGEAFVPASTATYTVTGEDDNGCFAQSEITVVVYELPVVEAQASDLEICAGEMLILSGNGAGSYTWDNDVVDGESFTPGSTETYTVTGLDVNGCVASDVITVVVNANPLLDLGGDVTVCSYNLPIELEAPAGFSSYEWVGGSNTQALTVYVGGTYACTVTNEFGCEDSDEQMVIVDACLGIEELESEVSIYPNPFNSQLTIQLGNWTSAFVTVYDLNGALVLEQFVSGSEVTMQMNSISAGVYMLKASNGNEIYQTRIIKN
jgi:hypothetical protein